LRLATRGRDERTVTVAAPSNDVKGLLALVRLHLEAHPPAAAIEALCVAAIPERLRAAQLDLFRPSGPAPARLAVTLARLTAICGADHVGMPVVADSHRPEAYGVESFQVTGENQAAVRRLRGYAVREDSGPVTANRLTANRPTSDTCSLIPLALRAIRPPQSIEVFCARDQPEFVRGAQFAGRVVHAAGPWRMHAEWWNNGGYTRDYYDTQLTDGCVYRLYCDLATQGWFVEGVYD